MAKSLDLTGQRYGRLVVTGPYVNRKWTCLCDCGNTKEVFISSLRKGLTRSCGCLNSEAVSQRNKTHGRTKRNQKPVEFTTWINMRNRCSNPANKAYAHYGGRGIAVCERWQSSFEAFYEDMGPRPSPDHQIDRIDNDGPYSPENCRWVSRIGNMNNRSDNHRITFRGVTQSLADWSRALDLPYDTLHQRINKLGWSVERALTEPPRQKRRRVKA